MKRNFLFILLIFISLIYFIIYQTNFRATKTANNYVSEIPETKTDESRKTVLLFAGDMMFDRYIRQIAEKHGYQYIIEPVKDILLSNNTVIANLEGPVTSRPSVSVGSEIGSKPNFIYTFDPKIVDILSLNNIRIVNIGNNHIMNQGIEGIYETKKYLDMDEISYFGNTGTSESQRTTTFYINEINTGFVNFNEFVQNGKEAVFEDIDKIKKAADICIVFAHWGPEYTKDAPQYIKDLARSLVDRGANLVIGTHPHVIWPKEEYRKAMIYYSLGNFIMDQYFSEETKKGMLVKMEIDKTEKGLDFSFQELYVKMDLSGQTKLLE